MFEVGDFVVHGNSGVCRVDAVQTMDGIGADRQRVYYTLVPLYTSGSKLFVPTDSKKVIIRSVMTKKDVKKLMDEWNEIETLRVENDKNREEVYKEALRSCDSRQWVRLIKTSYQRNQTRIEKGKKATTSDERYLQLAIPLEMSRGEAEAYFVAKVRKNAKEAVTV